MSFVSAEIYDAIYRRQKNYYNEAREVLRLIQSTTGRITVEMNLLDVGCGTGLHLQHMGGWFDRIEGLDSSLKMVKFARARLALPSVHHGNMVNFDLATSFDVVTCLFSAIGYVLTLNRMRTAVATMARHLKPGGILIIEPWITPDNWKPGTSSWDTVEGMTLNIARFVTSMQYGVKTKLTMNYMVANTFTGEVSYFTEEHVLRLYTVEEYEAAFSDAGLDVKFIPEGISPNGRGVFVGVKPK